LKKALDYQAGRRPAPEVNYFSELGFKLCFKGGGLTGLFISKDKQTLNRNLYFGGNNHAFD
jgi:hypothetical protein